MFSACKLLKKKLQEEKFQENEIIKILDNAKINGINYLPLNAAVPIAAKKNQFDLVFKLIDLYKCNVNESDKDGCTALFYAFTHGNIAAIENFKRRGVTSIGFHTKNFHIKENSAQNSAGIRERRSSFPLFLTKKELLKRIKPRIAAGPPILSKTQSG